MSDEARLAMSARITPKGVEIDGEPFPFYVAEDGVRIKPSMRHGLSIVTVDVLIDGPVVVDPDEVTVSTDEEREQVERWQGGAAYDVEAES